MNIRTLNAICLLPVLAIFLHTPVFCQDSDNFSYLIACFKNSDIDTSDVEIKGIGDVETVNFSSNEIEEKGLTYFNIPRNKKNKAPVRLSQSASNRHIQTWKNNSRIILNDSYKTGETSIVDLRLHMLIENIYMQVIIVCDKERIYEIMCFRDINNKAYFDTLVKKIKEKNCLL